MDYLLFIVAIIVAVGLGFLARPPALFVIRYRAGVPKVVRGHVNVGIRDSIAEICDQHPGITGTISAIRGGKRVRLKFSASIPQGCQQQIRNMMLCESKTMKLSRMN